MARVHSYNRPSSFLVGPALGRLSATIAPLVQTELAGILIAELERHFNEQVLSELQKRVEAIIERELPGRIEAIIERELPGRIEAIIERELPGRIEAIIERELPGRIEAIIERELPGRIEAIIERELPGRIEAIIERELPGRIEAIIERELPGRIEAIIERELPGRMATMLGRVLPGNEPSNANKILVDRFTQVFEGNLWGDSETVSGWGSRKDSTSVAAAISALEIAKEKIRFMSINDIPCGDFNWIDGFLKSVPEISYRGFDIVPTLIKKNKMLFPGYQFEFLDITSVLPPRADLILSKDFFNHLVYEDVKKALANMKKSHSEYLLASNNFDFPNEELHANAGNASRHLDLCAEPFNLPVPIWRTHYMGLWKFSDIDVDQ